MGGFVVFEDGRAFAPSTGAWSLSLQKVAEALQHEAEATEFSNWLFRISDAPAGFASLDLRELTPRNRVYFHEACRRAEVALRTAGKAAWPNGGDFDAFMKLFELLVRMKESIDRGEPAMALNPHMSAALEARGRIHGPGWLKYLSELAGTESTKLARFERPVVGADLSETLIPGGCLRHLRMLPQLRILDLSRTDVQFDDLLELAGHPSLGSIHVHGVHLTRNQLERLKGELRISLTGEPSES